jgi:predicted nucleic acid-binding protein
MKIVINDSSNLILISKIEVLELLLEIFNEILIPQAVYKEAVEDGKKLKKLDAILIEKKIDDGKIKIKEIKDVLKKKEIIEKFNIHDGEAEAIVLYLEENADVLGTDDYRSIKTCKILNINYFTTLSFLYLCFERNKLSKQIILLKFDTLGRLGWYKKDLINYFKDEIEKKVV